MLYQGLWNDWSCWNGAGYVCEYELPPPTAVPTPQPTSLPNVEPTSSQTDTPTGTPTNADHLSHHPKPKPKPKPKPESNNNGFYESKHYQWWQGAKRYVGYHWQTHNPTKQRKDTNN